MKHANISIFIPHLGCPFNCIFCDQYKITGSDGAVTPSNVYDILSSAAADPKLSKKDTQIAFFGGSFTAIDRQLMTAYLETAVKFVGDGLFDSIRISTRPDCIDREILEILKEYRVKTVELGIQSFDDTVLRASKRGYTSARAVEACELIRDSGFELGLQMMCGLPCDTPEKDIATAKKIIALGCKQVRIYPVIVIRGTELCEMYRKGLYTPLELDEAVDICAELYSLFTENNVHILKIGLHTDSDGVAGPFHPSFGELVRSKVFFTDICGKISPGADCIVKVAPQFLSIAVGNGKRNLKNFKDNGYNVKIAADPLLSGTERLIITD